MASCSAVTVAKGRRVACLFGDPGRVLEYLAEMPHEVGLRRGVQGIERDPCGHVGYSSAGLIRLPSRMLLETRLRRMRVTPAR